MTTFFYYVGAIATAATVASAVFTLVNVLEGVKK